MVTRERPRAGRAASSTTPGVTSDNEPRVRGQYTVTCGQGKRMHRWEITHHPGEKPPNRAAYACNGNIAEIGFNEIFIRFMLTFFGFPVSMSVANN